MRYLRQWIVLSFLTVLLMPSAQASYEKTLLWGPKQVGVGGIGVIGVSGSEAILYNPAQLLTVSKSEVSVNFSPSLIQLEGPLVVNNTSLESSQQLAPVTGITGAFRLTDQLALGLGAYASGGARALFEDVNFSALNTSPLLPVTIRPDIQNNLDLVEFSPGLSYELMEGLRLGVSWRVIWAKATIKTAFLGGSGASTSFNAVSFENLDQFKADGFKVGLAYDSSHWGVGLAVRSPVKLKLSGESSGQNEALATGTVSTITGGNVTVESYVPLQINAGVYFDLDPKIWRALFEYSFNRYSQNRELNFAGSNLTGGTLSGASVASANIRLNARDFNMWRLGTEYRLNDTCVLRGGYVLSGSSVPKDSALASLHAPGAAHGITVGAGHVTHLGSNPLELNLALEYDFEKGSVGSSDLGVYSGTATVAKIGSYSTRILGAHLGATLKF